MEFDLNSGTANTATGGVFSDAAFGGGGGGESMWRGLDNALGVGANLAGRLADIYATVRTAGKPNSNPPPGNSRPETMVDLWGTPGQLQGPPSGSGGMQLGTLLILGAIIAGVWIVASAKKG